MKPAPSSAFAPHIPVPTTPAASPGNTAARAPSSPQPDLSRAAAPHTVGSTPPAAVNTASTLTLHVCLSTHWDREWLQTFEEYRFRLVRLVDHLLDILEREPGLRFFFDGQTIVLEDYLEVRPSQRPRLLALAQAGRLTFGPWYILADQFLEGDEATVRNLLIGTALARDYGRPVLEGYNPDSFGSVGSLPAILAGFGIRHANMGRGVPALPSASGTLFWWEAPDGSRVLAAHQSYPTAVTLAYPTVWDRLEDFPPTPESVEKKLRDFLNKKRAHFPGTHLYVSIGVDHLELRPGLERLLADAATRIGGVEIRYSTPEEFLAASEAELPSLPVTLPTVRGELRGDSAKPMTLQGVLSTDPRLKQRNRLAELRLARLVDPLDAWRRIAGGEDQSDPLRHAWKQLLRGHPHDSICACSVDDVMADVHQRYARLENVLTLMTERWLADADTQARAPHGDAAAPRVLLVNPLPGRGRAPFSALVRVHRRLPAADAWLLREDQGRAVGVARPLGERVMDLETDYAPNPRLLLARGKTPDPRRDWSPRAVWDSAGLAHRPPEAIYTLLEIEGVLDFGTTAGTHALTLEPAVPEPASDLVLGPDFIANDTLRLSRAADGHLHLLHLPTGRTWTPLGLLEDQADAGDSYDFNPLIGDVPLRSAAPVTCNTRRFDAFTVELEATLEFDLPEALSEGAPLTERRLQLAPPEARHGRRSPRLLRHRIVARYRLRSGVDHLELRLEWDNQALHHRLRLALPAAPEAPPIGGAHFSAVQRAWQDGTALFTTFPFTDHVHLGGSGPGWGVAVAGIHEAEARLVDDRAELLLTLCRSVDSIGHPGMDTPLENAKALGRHHADFALFFAASPADTAARAARFLSPLIAQGTRSALPSQPWYELAGDGVFFSTAKRAENTPGTILRFYNVSEQPTTATLRWHWPHSASQRVELNETPSSRQGPQTSADGSLRQALGPSEIVTLFFADPA